MRLVTSPTRELLGDNHAVDTEDGIVLLQMENLLAVPGHG